MPNIKRTTRSEGEDYVFRIYAPLYGFQSDLDVFELSAWEFRRYSPDTLNAVPEVCSKLRTHLLSYPPDFVVTWTIPCEQSMVVSKITSDDTKTELYTRAHARTLAGMVNELFTTLRLFKEGNFFNSGLFSYSTGTVKLAGQPGETEIELEDDHFHLDTTFASLMGYRDASYYVDSAEIASLQEFIDEMSPLFEPLHRFANFAKAFEYFNCSYSDMHLRDKFKDLVVCLEALLLPKKSDEITHKLALHVANLINTSEVKKQELIKEVKLFYDARSALVHGSDLKTKHFRALENIGRLREIVRRTVLGSIALLLEIGIDKSFPDGLKEMEPNEELRNRVLLRASKFLPRKM